MRLPAARLPALLASLASLASLTACRTPTSVTLVLSSDVACSDHPATSVSVSRAASETIAPELVTSVCQPDGHIGTVVVVPASDKDEDLRIRVVTRVGDATCEAPTYGQGCIVSRRQLRFLAHEELTVPIAQQVDCAGVACDATTTCRKGSCVVAQVDVDQCQAHPEQCGIEIAPDPAGGAGGVAGASGAAGAAGVSGAGASGAGASGAGAGGTAGGQSGAGPGGAGAGQAGAGQAGAGAGGGGQGGAGSGMAGQGGEGGASAGGAGSSGQGGLGGAGMSGTSGQGGVSQAGSSGQAGANQGGAGAQGGLGGVAGQGGSGGAQAGAGQGGAGGREVVALTSPYNSSCAQRQDSSVQCWGYNTWGQLGQGDMANRGDNSGEMGAALKPVDLGAAKVQQLSANGEFVCALTTGGQVLCWGENFSGQLGQGDTNSHGSGPGEMGAALKPVDLGGAKVQQLSAGTNFVCALATGDQVLCWGNNVSGQLGQGDTVNRGDNPGEMGAALEPVDLGVAKVQQLAAGGTSVCVLTTGGQVLCWGNNSVGQLGQGDTVTRGDNPGEMGAALKPVDLGGAEVQQLTASSGFVCALTTGGQVLCWGDNFSGQLGQGDKVTRGDNPGEMGAALKPVDLGGAKVQQLSAGANFVCALTTGGQVLCWGDNTEGQLGQGDTVTRGDNPGEMGAALKPVDLGGAEVQQLAAGGTSVCALTTGGQVLCWGGNGGGQLGQGDTVNRGDNPGEMGAALKPVDLGP